MTNKERAARVRQIREDLSMTQQDLADDLKVDRVTVTRWETGAAVVKPDRLHHIECFYQLRTHVCEGGG